MNIQSDKQRLVLYIYIVYLRIYRKYIFIYLFIFWIEVVELSARRTRMTKDEKCTKMRTHRSGNMPGGRKESG